MNHHDERLEAMSEYRENIEISSQIAMHCYIQGYCDGGGDPTTLEPHEMKAKISKAIDIVVDEIKAGVING